MQHGWSISKSYIFGSEGSYNYYDIDADKILLYKKLTINILLDIMM